MEYEFIDRTLFFPDKGILVIGDLHIGYETQLKQSGVLIPERQIKDLLSDLKKIIQNKEDKIKKIIFMGDIKHAFSFEREESREFDKIIEFLGNYLPPENIIFLKGNHDTIDYTPTKGMRDFYIEGGTGFVHGDLNYPEIWDKKIKIIVMGHIHPSVILSESPGVKKENYKCFLVGRYKGKEIIILPSFLDFVEGAPVNHYDEVYEDYFSIIPKKALMKFKVHVIGEDKTYEFGDVRGLE